MQEKVQFDSVGVDVDQPPVSFMQYAIDDDPLALNDTLICILIIFNVWDTYNYIQKGNLSASSYALIEAVDKIFFIPLQLIHILKIVHAINDD